jgi:hypothetical protein
MTVTSKSPVTGRARGIGAALLLALLSLVECQFIVGALLRKRDQVEFVLANVEGILTGNAVWKSSQHRLLGPALLRALEGLTDDPVRALGWFLGLAIFAENLLLWRILRGKQSSHGVAIAGVVAFGLVHFLSLYKLEYPWDSIDVLLFTGFGYWASQQARLGALSPLMLIGLFNHETVLYIPLWCALAVTDRALPSARRQRELLLGVTAFVACFAGILALRELLYVAPGALPRRAAESVTPWLENPFHLRHNLTQFWLKNWAAGRAWISLSLLLTLLALAALLRSARWARAALWSLLVLLTVFCFGYVNETRLYLPLIAFWFGYRGPALSRFFERKVRASPGNGAESRQ